MVDLLPEIDVVPDDPFNSSPTDTNLMGPGALQVYRSGDKLPSGKAKTPLVSLLCTACLGSQTCRSFSFVQVIMKMWQQNALCCIRIAALLPAHSMMAVTAALSCCQSAHSLLLQVELPLGATEDRICGTIDIEKALQEGIKAYEPGLLVSCCSSTSSSSK